MRTSKKGNTIQALLSALFLAVSGLFLAECSVGVHEEVYSLAASKARVVTNVVITPSAEGEYAFTADAIPTVTVECAIVGARSYYSFDGSPYRPYAGPITLPINDRKLDQTIRVSAYSSHPDYADSEPVTQEYRFVATRVPAPTIGAISSPYYRYDEPLTITLSCSLAGATVWYSTNGGASYTRSTGSFLLPVPVWPDWYENRTIAVTAYASAPDYLDSAREERSFTFYGYGAIVTIAGTGIPGNPVEGEDARTQPITNPDAIYVDDGRNVYFTGNQCVWKIAAGTNAITRLAGSPGLPGFVNGPVDARTACLENPLGLSGDDASDQLYISASGSNQILRVPYSGGTITRILGKPDGTRYAAGDSTIAPDAGIDQPRGIQYAAGGTVYFCESMRYAVRAFIPPTGTVMTVAGTLGFPGNDQYHFQWPLGLYVADGTVSVADNGNSRVRAVTPPDIEISDPILGVNLVSQIRKSDNENFYLYQDPGTSQKLIEWRFLSNTAPVAGSTAPSAGADGSLATEVELSGSEDFFVVPYDGVYIPEPTAHRIRKVILY